MKMLKPEVPVAIYSADWEASPEHMRFADACVPVLPRPLVRPGDSGVQCAARGRRVGGIQQQVREHLTQLPSIDLRMSIRAIAGFDRNLA
jgi:hypothetical protein